MAVQKRAENVMSTPRQAPCDGEGRVCVVMSLKVTNRGISALAFFGLAFGTLFGVFTAVVSGVFWGVPLLMCILIYALSGAAATWAAIFVMSVTQSRDTDDPTSTALNGFAPTSGPLNQSRTRAQLHPDTP